MSKSTSHFSHRASRFQLLPALVPLFLLILSAGKSQSFASESCVLPEDYGRVVCRFNEQSPHQLFIIGIAHRDSLTRSNENRTPRVQAEVYKIGEWLIQNEGVELLLPEGFFSVSPKKKAEKRVRSGSLATASQPGAMEALERRFSDDRRFVNAEMLLKENFPLLLRQVEDKDLYQAASENIRLLVEARGNAEKSSLIRSELDYHQKKRVGTMLQRIPGIVDDEFRQGNIDSRKAVFTIGLSHVSDILKYLEQRKISVRSPLFAQTKYDDYIDELKLTKEDFGISVIIPKSLINDREAMEKNNLKAY